MRYIAFKILVNLFMLYRVKYQQMKQSSSMKRKSWTMDIVQIVINAV